LKKNNLICGGQIAVVVLLSLLLTACSQEPATGPEKVRWDREVCARCSMAVSDPNFSAQIRQPANQYGVSTVHKFDDIGCAVIWLKDQPWKDEAATEIWVNDYRNGKWIDARKAYYVDGKLTPMNYGLGAQSDPVDHSLDYAAASKHIMVVEEREHIHGGLHQYEN